MQEKGYFVSSKMLHNNTFISELVKVLFHRGMQKIIQRIRFPEKKHERKEN